MSRYLIFLSFILLCSTLNAQKLKESFHPEQPFEQRTDTVINSDKVSWTFQSIQGSYVVQQYQNGNKLFKYNYRNAELKIELPSDTLIFDKMSFRELIDFDYSSEFIWYRTAFKGFNNSTNEIIFSVSITKPETDWTYQIYLYVSLNGISRFELMQYEDDH